MDTRRYADDFTSIVANFKSKNKKYSTTEWKRKNRRLGWNVYHHRIEVKIFFGDEKGKCESFLM